MAGGSDTPRLEPEAIRQLRKGVEEFNSGKFFECHDTLEDIWRGMRGPARVFLQGLIQISVGFYHLNNRNLRGGQSQLEKGLRKLEGYGEEYLGVELVQLRGEVRVWLDKVRAGEKLEAELKDLPKFRFRPPVAM
jgi:predicted metal-dependent hydrolase